LTSFTIQWNFSVGLYQPKIEGPFYVLGTYLCNLCEYNYDKHFA